MLTDVSRVYNSDLSALNQTIVQINTDVPLNTELVNSVLMIRVSANSVTCAS